jgi:nicotinamidase-related amidase
MTDTALLVIDAQESFRQRANWLEVDSPTYLRNQQALIDGALNKGWKIVRVLHAEPEGIFSPASGFVRPLAELRLDKPDLEFHKFRHSAFVGSPLEVFLIENGIRRLVISGIRSEQCCETTSRHGSDLGWQVDYVTEATHTMPLTDATGRTWTAEELKARTAAVLDGRFARVCTIAEALAYGADEGRAAAA